MMRVSDRLDKIYAGVRRLTPPDVRLLVEHAERTVRDPSKVLRLAVRMSALCFIVALLLSHKLWFQDDRLYAPAPLMPWLSGLPHVVNFVLYGAMLACCAALLFFPRWRHAGIFIVAAFVFLSLQDQLRGQFYLTMCAFSFLAAALLPRKIDDAQLDPLRYMTIGIYFWAGFYKINLYFMQFLFPWFISPWFPYGSVAVALGVAAPFLEAAIGVFLLLAPTRWIGQFLACIMLFFVVASLGPSGHDVMRPIWLPNVYLDGLAILLFLGSKRSLLKAPQMKKPLTLFSIAVFVLLPAFGMLALIGPHPSFKLYCACTPDAQLEFGAHEDLSFLPPELRKTLHENRVDATEVTAYLFQTSSPALTPGDQSYVAGMRGFCAKLSRPQDARLHVVSTLHFWSTEKTDRVYDLCADPQAASGH